MRHRFRAFTSFSRSQWTSDAKLIAIADLHEIEHSGRVDAPLACQPAVLKIAY